MATTTAPNLSVITDRLRTQNQGLSIPKNILDQVNIGDKFIISALKEINKTLLAQLHIQKVSYENDQLEKHLIPHEYQSESPEEIIGNSKELIQVVKDIYKLLDERLGEEGSGIGAAAAGAAGLGGIGALATRALPFMGVAGIALAVKEAFDTMEEEIEKQDWYKRYSEAAGKKLMDFFGMGSSSPMTTQQFEQQRISKTVGGEAARRSYVPSNKPMTQEQFEEQRISKVYGGESARKVQGATSPPMTQEQFQEQVVPKTTGTEGLKGSDRLMAQTFNAFKNAGFSDEQAQSMVAEVGRENSFDPSIVFGRHVDPANQKTNVGFMSWQGERGKKLEERLYNKGLIDDQGKLVRSQETLNEMAKFSKEEMETNPSFAKTKSEFLDNPNVSKEKAAEVLGKNYVKWRYDDPKYASGHEHREKYYSKMGEILREHPPEQADTAKKEPSLQMSPEEANKLRSSAEKVSDADLRIKGSQATAGGSSEEGLMNLAKNIQGKESELPGGLNRFTAFNDEYHHHANPHSKHTQGLAMDFSLKDSSKSGEAVEYIKKQLVDSGMDEKDFKIIDEYKNPSGHATGGHIHVNFANKEAAQKYASLTGQAGQTYAKADVEEAEEEEVSEPKLKEEKKLTEEQQQKMSSDYLAKKEMPQRSQEEQERMSSDYLTKKEMPSRSTGDMFPETYPTSKPSATKQSSTKSVGDLFPETYPTSATQEPSTGPSTGDLFPERTPSYQNQNYGGFSSIPGSIGRAASYGQGLPGMIGGGSMGGIIGAISGMGGVAGMGGTSYPLGNVMGTVANMGGMVGAGGMSSLPAIIGSIGGIAGGMGGGMPNVGGIGGLGQALPGMIGGGSLGGILGAVSGIGSIAGAGNQSYGVGNAIGSIGNMGGMVGAGGASAIPAMIGTAGGVMDSIGSGIGNLFSEKPTQVSSLESSPKIDGSSIEGMSNYNDSSKQEMMMPAEPAESAPAGGGGGAGGGPVSGGGTSDSNPSVGGVMGIDVGVRNEEATLLRAQFGSVRIV